MSWTQGGWTAESGGENASVAAAPVSSAVASGAGEDGGGGGVCSSADADAGGVEVASSADCIASEADARAESTVERPLIGATMEPLSTLAAEYEHGAAAFRSKIAALGAKYGALRRVRGDGNCFFRGVTFAYLESLLSAADREKECARLASVLAGCKASMTAVGYSEIVFEDQLEMLSEWVDQIAKGELPLPLLLAHFTEDMVSNQVVMFLRMLASCEMARREGHFEPFVAVAAMEGGESLTFGQYRNRTEAMGEESDHPAIVALSDALGLPLRVLYLDASTLGGEGAEPNALEFVPESVAGAEPRVTLLYRPGHYDILYHRVPS